MKSIFNNAFFIFIALAVLVALSSPFASVNPDGLDWTIEQNAKSKITEPEKSDRNFLFADYKIPFIKNEAASTIFSGLTGLLIIVVFFKIFFKLTIRPASSINANVIKKQS